MEPGLHRTPCAPRRIVAWPEGDGRCLCCWAGAESRFLVHRWDALVDVAKPGDRVEVTGIFRATSVRTNPRHRTLRSIYKTFVDIVHIRKLDKNSRRARCSERV